MPLREDPASRPFFSERWPGTRNDYTGEAGFRFVAEVDFEVTALGRPAEPPLMEAAMVTLWETETEESLVSAVVGPSSRVEGFYAWEPLAEPVALRRGREYRFSLRIRAGMQDRWCDAKLDAETAAAASWPSLGAFLGGVVRNKHDFPNRPDGDFRRPGIVNFKALVDPDRKSVV